MNREVHVRFREDVGVEFPHVTHSSVFRLLIMFQFDSQILNPPYIISIGNLQLEEYAPIEDS